MKCCRQRERALRNSAQERAVTDQRHRRVPARKSRLPAERRSLLVEVRGRSRVEELTRPREGGFYNKKSQHAL